MTFKTAVMACSEFKAAYRGGLQALRERDRNRIKSSEPRRLAGSVDVEAALHPVARNTPLWGYGIGINGGETEEAVWVEVHSATSGEVKTVIAKVKWLKNWLGANGPNLLRMTRPDEGFVWVASGTVSLPHRSREARQLGLAGVSFPRRRLRLP
jgi:hypothetical protein